MLPFVLNITVSTAPMVNVVKPACKNKILSASRDFACNLLLLDQFDISEIIRC